MKSECQTEVCNKWCEGCEEYTDNLDNWATKGINICEECNEKYEDTTGYCSLSCCLGNGCDQTC